MSVETGNACVAPKPPAATGSSAAKPQDGAGDASGEGGTASFVSVLATSMEPISDAAAQAAAAPRDDRASAAAAPCLVADASALLAQNLNWAVRVAEPDSMAAGGIAASAASGQGSLAPSFAAEGDPLVAEAPGASGRTRAGCKAAAKGLAGKLTSVRNMADVASGVGQTRPDDTLNPRAAPALSRTTEVSRALQDVANQMSARGATTRANESRLAAEVASFDARGLSGAHVGIDAALGIALSEGSALQREAANTRSSERPAFRPLPASAGATAVGAWAEQAFSGGSAAAATTYSLDPAAPAPATAVAEKVHYWISRSVQNAELRLDAFGGGSVEVSISVLGREAQVEFRTDQPEARKMLQDAMPLLKDLLKGEGLLLSGGFVGSSAQPDPGAQKRRSYPPAAKASEVNVELPVLGATSSVSRTPGRAVDVFV